LRVFSIDRQLDGHLAAAEERALQIQLVELPQQAQVLRALRLRLWSISEILAHLADTEIVVAWRLRHILGNNGALIQACDQNVWAETFDYAHREAKESQEFFQALRARNLAMLKALPLRSCGRTMACIRSEARNPLPILSECMPDTT
jgi:hypothetical protein